MFYETDRRDKTKLPHDPFKAIVAPRPIGWISTRALDGRINLAPYSFFNGFGSAPPIVGFSSDSGSKDSASFATESREFVFNLATLALRDKMNATSAPLPRGENEFLHAGLTMAPCSLVAAPRVGESPASLECKVVEVVQIRDRHGKPSSHVLILGEVVGVHIDDAYIRDGRFDITLAHPIARCGYQDYAVVDAVFSLARPKGGGDA